MAFLVEKKILDELRKIIKDLTDDEPEDFILIAFLKAANMDKVKAKEMFRQYVEKRMNLTNTRGFNYNWKPNAEQEKNMKYQIIGTDYEDRIVIWFPAGRWDLKKLLQKGFKTEVYKLAFKMGDDIFREVFERSMETGKTVRVIGFTDLQEISFGKLSHFETIQVSLELGRIFDPVLFPLVDKSYVVNGSRLLSFIIKILSPVLSRETIAKIEMLGSEETKWLAALDKKIPLEVLPMDYGGLGPKVLV